MRLTKTVTAQLDSNLIPKPKQFINYVLVQNGNNQCFELKNVCNIQITSQKSSAYKRNDNSEAIIVENFTAEFPPAILPQG